MRRAQGTRGWRTAGALVGVLLFTACTASSRSSPPPVPIALPEPSASFVSGVAPPFVVAPDPALQALIDPSPCGEALCWLGADVATSIQVGPDQWVWLFGDTLLGRVSNRCTARGCTRERELGEDLESSLVRNSVGVLVRSPDGALSPVVKYWRNDGGRPAPILDARVPGAFLWPMVGRRVGQVLLIGANRHTPESGLAPTGNVFVRVWNPEAPPDLWSYTLHEVPNARTGADEPNPLTWTAAMTADEGFLYVFGELGAGLGAATVLSRLQLSDIDDPDWQPRPEYLTDADCCAGPFWTRDFRPQSLHRLRGLPGTSEATVNRDPALGWISFQIAPLDFDVRLYSADELSGPWADRGVVYRVPPPWSVVPRVDCRFPEIACGQDHYAVYAIKSHPEIAPPSGVALSYNINLLFGDIAATQTEIGGGTSFYVPQLLAGAPVP
jgi:hypothetical protein